MFWALFWTFSVLSLLAVGGANAVLPEMHRLLVEQRGWLDDATFAQLYALAQAAPGPNILVASVMGWHIAGAQGLAAATLGMLLPAALLAWTVAGVTQRLAGHPWLVAVKAGLVPVAVGLILAAGLTMAQAAGDRAVWMLVTAASGLFVWRTDYSPLWVLAAGGVAGLAIG